MLVFDVIFGLVVLGVVLAVLFGGIGQAARWQRRLEAEQAVQVGSREAPVRCSRQELDEALRPVVRVPADQAA